MKPTVCIRKALADKKLLGGTLAGESWQAWRVLMIAAMGERLTDTELPIFTRLTGRDGEPLQPVEELVCVVGRRGGKSSSDGDACGVHWWLVQASACSWRAWCFALYCSRSTSSHNRPRLRCCSV